MEKNNRFVRSTLDVYTVLTIVFVVLKLCRVISWSWVWVLSPLWIGFAISIIAFVIVLFIIQKGVGEDAKQE